MRIAIFPLVVLSGGLALAQQSSSFKLQEHVFNAGGHPHQGTVLTSASFRVTLDALGDGVAGLALASASFRMDGGFVPAYPPPGEVLDLRFTDSERLAWQPERSRGAYNLYRDAVCLQPDIPDESVTDTALPASGEVLFYLVTVENRLGEEGTRGSDSDGVERPERGFCP